MISSAIAQSVKTDSDVVLNVHVTEYLDATDEVTTVEGKTGDLTNGENVLLKFPTTGNIKVS